MASGNGRSKAPAFQWYAADWLADMHVRNMSLAARGLYADLLSLEWREGPLPDNPALLARAVSSPLAEVEAVWVEVKQRFNQHPDGTLYNPRLERERRSLNAFKQAKVDAGRKGGLKTASLHLSKTPPAQAAAQAPLKPSTASASATATSESTDKEGERPTAAAPPVSKAVVRQGRTHEAITAHLHDALAPERREAVAEMKADERRRLVAELVFAYWQVKRQHQQALYDDQREGILVRALKANRDDVSELLYVVDGASRDPWPDRKSHDGIDILFRNRSQVERFAAFCPAFREGKPHHTAVRYGLSEAT